MHKEASVITERDGRVGRIRLNRPKALNALDLPMIRALVLVLAEWRDDPQVHAVVTEGEGDRAFCSGGDIRAVRNDVLVGETARVEAFYSEEYQLNLTIAEYPKPYIALVDGICMGGGIGVSVHGSHCVATERANFAMPETGIGLFPDIGATFFLPRLPGELGTYMALTGAQIMGADAVHMGLATHFVPRERMAALAGEISRDGFAVVAVAAAPLPPFSLAPHRATIDACFSAGSVPEILQRLEADGSAWARDTIATLRGRSPSSLCWSFALLREGARRNLAQCLAAELAATRTTTVHPDFAEGVRAMVVDKDRRPRWSPARLEDVDEAEIARMLQV
jgi:enoyl-CoA hydratase